MLNDAGEVELPELDEGDLELVLLEASTVRGARVAVGCSGVVSVLNSQGIGKAFFKELGRICLFGCMRWIGMLGITSALFAWQRPRWHVWSFHFIVGQHL